MKVISTKWIDTNKGDRDRPDYRARLVGREFKVDNRTDLFAATPPLESLRFILNICASHQRNADPRLNYLVMTNDVRRAYFYASARRPLYINIPAEDYEDGDEGYVAQLNLSLYGTRDAAVNWSETYTALLEKLGFVTGIGSPCNFHHPSKGISMTVHGDDFTSTGTEASLRWLDGQLQAAYEIKSQYLGPDAAKGHVQEVRVLNRVISWLDDGSSYEPDPRHAEMVVQELGLAGSKGVTTPGSRDDVAAMEKLNGPEDAPCYLGAADATRYRALCARLNYLSLDRADIQFAAKEASRRMAKPRAGDWHLLKRMGRYLVSEPRVIQIFSWCQTEDVVHVFTDSDWAGCHETRRSTSGGAAMASGNFIKGWSTTQATVALSSGEAELYALVKGTAQGLGIMAMAEDLGVQVRLMVHTDSSAAIGISARRGLGKLRHIETQFLWVQSGIRDGKFEVKKVNGAENVSDIFTKNVDRKTLDTHLDTMGFVRVEGRATSAPTMATAMAITPSSDPGGMEQVPRSELAKGLGPQGSPGRVVETKGGDGCDEWIRDGVCVARVHNRPRQALFTPIRVGGAPPGGTLHNVRITNGRYVNSMQHFRFVDSWKANGQAHRRLPEPWTGSTTFLSKQVFEDVNLLAVEAPGATAVGGFEDSLLLS